MSRTSETSQNRQVDTQSLQSAQNQQIDTQSLHSAQNLQVDTQSLQSAQILSVQQVPPSQSQQQNRSVSQGGRSDRQRIQRSNSSTSTPSGGSAGVAAGVRAEGVVATGSYQQYSAEGASGYAVNNGSFASAVSGERRQGRYRRQVIRLPDQAQGQVRQVRRRLPTPEPDTLERVYIQRTAGEVVEEITEIPTTPPPRIQERTVVEPAGPPQVIKRTIRVPPRGGSYGGYQQQQQGGYFQTGGSVISAGNYGSIPQAATGYQQQGFNFQTGGSVISAGNYGSIPQAAPSYQQQGFATYSGGYSAGPIPFASSYGSIGGGVYQQQQVQSPTFCFYADSASVYRQQRIQEPAMCFDTNSAGSNQPVPPSGCNDAYCFYI